MSVAEAATAHFKSIARQSIEVPEWGTTIYWDPITVEEYDKLFTVGQPPKIRQFIDLIVLKALDVDGKKMFDLKNKFDLAKCASPTVISRVAQQMFVVPSLEEMEKN